ncbi:RNA polymerase sigma factor [Sinomicrobium sp. FJxs]|uniref:RNA polymerase sigma factor n=1 Tax=Sinomicrobium weinanense TaxID=2842200 RepID=A0A926JV49_9FLAO|nr:RNA polymerase sigma factor [Sinomicrobium weinanense]MBU3124862.1 RNA polymerase sigma factor [Sinomicrobium weinanense]
MKIIPLYKDEDKLIRRASANDREAQHELYRKYAPKMLSVCRYYIKDEQFAEDVMIGGFFKVFTRIGTFRKAGSFEGWIRRIMVRECISFLRSEKSLSFIEEDPGTVTGYITDEGHAALETEDLQFLIDGLPEGYKTVFLMFAIEGYSHKEIARTLRISESTSKSQLFKARRMLQEKIKEQKRQENGTR